VAAAAGEWANMARGENTFRQGARVISELRARITLLRQRDHRDVARVCCVYIFVSYLDLAILGLCN
jgi:hypothetical protein